MLPLLTHSFPTLRSSELGKRCRPFPRGHRFMPPRVANAAAPAAAGTVSALERGIAVLRCFTEDVASLSNAELSLRTGIPKPTVTRSEEHTSELQSLMRISYAVFCLTKKTTTTTTT